MAAALLVASTVRVISMEDWYFEQGWLLGRALLHHLGGLESREGEGQGQGRRELVVVLELEVSTVVEFEDASARHRYHPPLPRRHHRHT
jgi:hypothetical protein